MRLFDVLRDLCRGIGLRGSPENERVWRLRLGGRGIVENASRRSFFVELQKPAGVCSAPHAHLSPHRVHSITLALVSSKSLCSTVMFCGDAGPSLLLLPETYRETFAGIFVWHRHMSSSS